MKQTPINSLAYGFACICGLITAALILIDFYSAPQSLPENVVVDNSQQAGDLLRAYQERSILSKWEKPIYIPTGIFIQSLEFTGPYNMKFTGYVWQKYSSVVSADVKQGIVLPEGEHQNFSEVYRVKQNDEELVGWRIVTTLRQEFEYDRYPFDRQEIWIRLWPADFARNIVLVPDFSAYPPFPQASKPGVEQDFVLEGWDIERVFFSYQEKNYNTGFGFENYAGQEDFPELKFNLSIRRKIISPLIIYALAPLAIMGLLFAIVVLFSKGERKRTMLDLGWTKIFTTLSAFFFATLIAQSSLRTSLKANGLVFVEFFHIMLYVYIFGVALVTAATALSAEDKTLEARFNTIPKLVFWPLVFGSLLFVTLVMF